MSKNLLDRWIDWGEGVRREMEDRSTREGAFADRLRVREDQEGALWEADRKLQDFEGEVHYGITGVVWIAVGFLVLSMLCILLMALV